ncbi:MAG: hypothetical protein QW153_03520 [Candidatus Bilamarchaeaceae archaeon]
MKFKVVEGCTSVDAYQLMYEKKAKIDLKKAAEAISKIGEILGETKVVLLAKLVKDKVTASVSIYEDGRVIIKNVSKDDAGVFGEIITNMLEEKGAFI